MKKTAVPVTIDEYISQFHGRVQTRLNQIREIIRKTVPEAEEAISYQMPAFRLHGILVYFAAQKNHIGFYPTSTGIIAFKEDLTGYVTGKGSVQFPHDRPLPVKIIRDIIRFRAIENLDKAGRKAKKAAI